MTIKIEVVQYILFDNLRYFRNAGAIVDHDTVLGTALSTVPVAGASPSKMFKQVSRYDMFINGVGKPAWPDAWEAETCKTLAKAIMDTIAAASTKVIPKTGNVVPGKVTGVNP